MYNIGEVWRKFDPNFDPLEYPLHVFIPFSSIYRKTEKALIYKGKLIIDLSLFYSVLRSWANSNPSPAAM